MKFYEVRYNLPASDDNMPVIHALVFRFKANAEAHAREDKNRRTVHPINGESYGLTLRDFRDEPHPPATPASGGKLVRRIRRGEMTCARELHRKRRHGWASHNVRRYGAFMRPPGSGAVEYQDPNAKHPHTPLVALRTGEPSVDPETASIVSGSAEIQANTEAREAADQ